MDRPPRHPDEPVINKEMLAGIAVQALAISVAVLSAFRIGLAWFPQEVHHAQTMAFATLSISELFRAYTARSERFNIWRIGAFSNRYMQYAVMSSLAILLAIIYVPALDPIFDTAFLAPPEWLVLLPLILTPAVTAEVTKAVIRRRVTRPT